MALTCGVGAIFVPLNEVYARLAPITVSPAAATLPGDVALPLPLSSAPTQILLASQDRQVVVGVGGAIRIYAIAALARRVRGCALDWRARVRKTANGVKQSRPNPRPRPAHMVRARCRRRRARLSSSLPRVPLPMPT